MADVRAKMRCTRISEIDINNGMGLKHVEVTLQAVYDTSGANKSWSEASPSGELRLLITNPAAYSRFKTGKSYFVDFTEAGENE